MNIYNRLYGEVVLRCARVLNNHGTDAEVPRCDKFATHIVDGYALCEEHATGTFSNNKHHNKRPRKARAHATAVSVDEIRAYLVQLCVPGLVKFPKEEKNDGSGSAETARASASER